MILSLPSFITKRPSALGAPQWLPAAIDIARSHGLSPTAPQIFSTGANLVVGLDEKLILKIFPPMLGPVRLICIEGWQHKADDLLQLQELIWPDRTAVRWRDVCSTKRRPGTSDY
jgi:hypothetical protein